MRGGCAVRGEAAGVPLLPGSIVRVLACGVATRPCERRVRPSRVQPVSARVSEGVGDLLRDGGELRPLVGVCGDGSGWEIVRFPSAWCRGGEQGPVRKDPQSIWTPSDGFNWRKR